MTLANFIYSVQLCCTVRQPQITQANNLCLLYIGILAKLYENCVITLRIWYGSFYYSLTVTIESKNLVFLWRPNGSNLCCFQLFPPLLSRLMNKLKCKFSNVYCRASTRSDKLDKLHSTVSAYNPTSPRRPTRK